MIHKALQHDQSIKDEKNTIEINIASLIKQLGEMAIKPPGKGTKVPERYITNNSNLKLQELILGED